MSNHKYAPRPPGPTGFVRASEIGILTLRAILTFHDSKGRIALVEARWVVSDRFPVISELVSAVWRAMEQLTEITDRLSRGLTTA